MSISAPVLQFNFGHTYASASPPVITNNLGANTAQGDMIYVTVSGNQTGNGGGLAYSTTTVTDSQGNRYERISQSQAGGWDGVHVPPVLFTETATFVSLNSVPLTTSDTITVTTNTGASFSGDFIVQCFSSTGPINQDKGFIYVKTTGGTINSPTPTPSNYHMDLPRLNTNSQIAVGTVCVFGATISADPAGWTATATKTQGGIVQKTYTRIVSDNSPLTLNPTLSSSAGYANVTIDTYYDATLPAISNLQVQGQDSVPSGGMLQPTIQYQTNFNDLIIVQVGLKGSVLLTPHVTDSQSNVYTLGVSNVANGIGQWSFYCMGAKPLNANVTSSPDTLTVTWPGSTVTDGTCSMMAVSSCGTWAKGATGTGSTSASSTTPTYTTGTLPQSTSLAVGYVTALTASITDPTYTAGWGMCPNAAPTATNIWCNAYAQVVESNSALTLAPTLGSGVASCVNIETFYVTGDPASPNIATRAIAYADFLAGTYQLNGAPSSLGAMFSQSGSYTGSVSVDNNGLLAFAGTTKGSAPVASAALLSAINANIAGGLVVVCEWQTACTRGGGNQMTVWEIDGSVGSVSVSENTSGLSAWPYAEAVTGTGAGGDIKAKSNPAGMYDSQVMNPGQRNMSATRFTNSSLAVSVNGGTVGTDSATAQTWPASTMYFGVKDWTGTHQTQTVHISFLGIYPASAVADGNLASYSLPCTRPVSAVAGQFTQGHVF